MEAFSVSTFAVALGEIGDKTQLLALLLSARYRRPLPIILGILVATVFNHGLAGWLGSWIHAAVPAQWLRWGLGACFLAVAAWALIPDQLKEDEAASGSANVFWVSLVSFFLAEVGDKTQVATVVLAARYGELIPVVLGTTLGMLIADVPAVWAGGRVAHRLPLRMIRIVAASVFALVGLAVWAGWG